MVNNQHWHDGNENLPVYYCATQWVMEILCLSPQLYTDWWSFYSVFYLNSFSSYTVYYIFLSETEEMIYDKQNILKVKIITKWFTFGIIIYNS